MRCQRGCKHGHRGLRCQNHPPADLRATPLKGPQTPRVHGFPSWAGGGGEGREGSEKHRLWRWAREPGPPGVGAGGGAEGGVCRESLSRALFPSDSDTTGAQARLPQPQCRDQPWDVCCETRLCSETGWRAAGSDLAASTPRLQPLCARQYSLLSAKKGHSPSVHTDRSTWSDAPTQKAHKFPLLLPGAELSLPGEG